MRTPCQDNPEMWVSDLVTSRREAAELCNTCPAIDWCTRETTKAKPTHGVWAGRDYSRVDALARKPVTGEAKVCAECDGVFERTYHSRKQWAAQMFCGQSCAGVNAMRRAS